MTNEQLYRLITAKNIENTSLEILRELNYRGGEELSINDIGYQEFEQFITDEITKRRMLGIYNRIYKRSFNR